MQLSTSNKRELLQYLLDGVEANKDTKRILDAILVDDEFLSEIQEEVHTTIVANLKAELPQNVLKAEIKSNKFDTTLRKKTIYLDLVEGDGNADII